MNFISRRIFLLLFVLPVVSLQAQTTRLFTLDQAIKTGLENSKTLKISAARLDQAKARYQEAVDGVYPSLKLSASYQQLSDLTAPTILLPGAAEPITLFPIYTKNYSTRLSLNETVFSGFRLKYAMESQQLLQRAASFDADKDKDETAFTISSAYFNLYKLKVSQTLVEDNLKQVNQHLQETEQWEKNGIATHNDVLRWQLQQSSVELARLDIRNNLDIANYDFNLLLGLDGPVQIEVDTNEADVSHSVKTLPEYLQQAAENRGDMQAQDLRSKAAVNNLKVSKNSYLPQVGIGGNLYDSRPNPRVIPPKDEFTFTWDVGVNLSWDLMSLYTNRHSVAETKAVLTQQEESKNLLSDAIRMEVNQQYLLYTESLERVKVMQKSLEQAEENYRLTDSRYRNSLVVLSDLLDANNTLLQTKINLTLARADVQVAYYRLMKSTGTLN